MVKRSEGSSKNTVLVEFKAPKELVELFDLRLSASFSSRSEALRALMRAFVARVSEGPRRPDKRS